MESDIAAKNRLPLALFAIVASVVGAASWVTPAVAEDAEEIDGWDACPHCGGPYGPGGEMRGAWRGLGLDEAQRESIRGIMASGREAGEPLRARLEERRGRLRALAADEDAAEEDLQVAVGEVLVARRALMEHRMAIHEQVREVLTPRQQARLLLLGPGEKRHRGQPHRGPGRRGERGR